MNDIIIAAVFCVVGIVLDRYVPEKEKITIFLKKFLYFLTAFVLPLFLLYLNFTESSVVDKTFVYKTAFFLSCLMFNLSMHFQLKIMEIIREGNRFQSTVMKTLLETKSQK